MREAHHFKRKPSLFGFSLTELLVIVSILGIFSSLAIGFSVEEIRKSRVNATAQQTAGWLEAAQRAAQRGIGCLVTIYPLSSATETTVIASSSIDTVSATPGTSISNHCTGIGDLKFETGSSGVNYRVVVSPSDSFVFTPRGTIFNPSSVDGSFTSDPLIRINITASGSTLPPSKCIRITPPFGSAEVTSC